ncbi:MAG: formate hydrogenlyase [Candidatus Accumulibacter sp.]|jgi:hydrogenase-4 component E|nr:formate hydrogenlyase [Accumulibacter sp.]
MIRSILGVLPEAGQIINLCAAIMLLLGFSMLAQRRILTLINLFLLQGIVLFVSILTVALSTGQNHLLWSAIITLALKVVALPWILHRLIRRLSVKWDVETLLNIPATMLVGIMLVIVAFNVATPISELSGTVLRSTIGIALACVLLSFLMMITRSKAVPQVIAFLAMENGLFFAATSATYGMPMVVELGIALDVMIGMVIFGVFFFQIRQQFDSLDIRQMERAREE